jgi:hypothetical protein
LVTSNRATKIGEAAPGVGCESLKFAKVVVSPFGDLEPFQERRDCGFESSEISAEHTQDALAYDPGLDLLQQAPQTPPCRLTFSNPALLNNDLALQCAAAVLLFPRHLTWNKDICSGGF